MERLTAERNCEIAFYEPVSCKFSNKNYIRNVLKRDIVSPVCKDDYYNGGVVDEDTLKQIYVKLGKIENVMKDHAIESIDYLEECIKRSDRYGELEEQIGCPIDVFFRALNEGIYNEGMKHFNIEHYFADRNSFDIHYNHSVLVFKVSDYKKTWWLKADRSE